MTKYILGLMSGSSLDGLDIALCKFTYTDIPKKGRIQWKILKSTTVPYTAEWQVRLRQTTTLSAIELLETDVALGQLFGCLIGDFLKDTSTKIDLVVSHGHTVFHFPERGFSTQIGHGSHIHTPNNLPVLYDLRMADIALGGQGAPLAPVVDEWLFPAYNFFLNLGGIVNISCNTKGGFVGYDVFGANQTLDALAQTLNLPYDKDGQLARKGTINLTLLNELQKLDFLQEPYPKSLDNQWVNQNISRPVLAFQDSIPNKLATVVEVIALQIAQETKLLAGKTVGRSNKMLITGGGAHNGFLIERIRYYAPKNLEIIIPPSSIINNKESLLMALMGLLYLHDIPNSNPSVTGARANSIGGVYCQF